MLTPVKFSLCRPRAPTCPTCSCVLPIVCLVMLLLTACRDPGILPRQEPDDEWLQARKPRCEPLCCCWRSC
jgi:hypothetical protein